MHNYNLVPGQDFFEDIAIITRMFWVVNCYFNRTLVLIIVNFYPTILYTRQYLQ